MVQVIEQYPETGQKVFALVLREFERYYTDRTVPAGPNIQGKGQRRRVIEERLVYSEFFDWP